MLILLVGTMRLETIVQKIKLVLFKMSERMNSFPTTTNDHSSNITYHLLTPEDKPEVKVLLLTKCYKVF